MLPRSVLLASTRLIAVTICCALQVRDAGAASVSDGVWTRHDNPATRPLLEYWISDHATVIDPVAQAIIVFGGNPGFAPDGEIDSMTTIPLANLSGAVPKFKLAGAPSARAASRAVWDPLRDRMLVFGGYDFNALNDLWSYSPRPTPSWTRLTPAGTPPQGRSGGGLTYDAVHDRLIVFGGHTTRTQSNGANLNDLWELPLSGPNAMTWAPLVAVGTPPSPRWGFVMLPDPARNRVVVHGGGLNWSYANADVYSDTYALDLSVTPPSWSQFEPSGFIPPPRIMHSAVIDPVRDRLVIYGGYGQGLPPVDYRTDVWALPLSGPMQWSLLQTGGTLPMARDLSSAVYDPVGHRMILIGGNNPGFLPAGYMSDIWSLSWDAATPATASLIDSHAEPGLVRLNWFVTDAASAVVTVQRQHGAEAWTMLGSPTSTASDRLTFEDRSVVAGESYRYRLSLREAGSETLTDAVEITVPTGYTLELAGATPNPAIGSNLRVTLSLPRTMPARLDLIDVSGRRVTSRDLSGLAPGRQTVALGDGVRLAPGLYVIRLEADGHALAKKALVVQ